VFAVATNQKNLFSPVGSKCIDINIFIFNFQVFLLFGYNSFLLHKKHFET
jgi:hypothetical protein